MEMVHNVTATRAVTALLLVVEHKNPGVRGKVARTIANLLHHRSADLHSTRELDALLPKLQKLLTDSSPEARSQGREIIRVLLHEGLFSRSQLEVHVSCDTLDKVEKEDKNSSVVLRGPSPRRARPPMSSRMSPAKSIGPLGSESPLSMRRVKLTFEEDNNDLRVSGISPRGAVGIASLPRDENMNAPRSTSVITLAAKKQAENSVELLALPGIFLALCSKSWQERKDALDTITDMILLHTNTLRDADKLESCVDRVLERLEDGSVKVNAKNVYVYNILGCGSCTELLEKDTPKPCRRSITNASNSATRCFKHSFILKQVN